MIRRRDPADQEGQLALRARHRRRRRRRRTALRLVATVATLGVLVTFWPARFGGSTVAILVSGDSMEPTYQTGDLVLARRKSVYHAGDIAVYRIPEGESGAGRLVVHRILEILPDGRFIFQGDNRDTPDSWRPDVGDVVGAAVVHVPLASVGLSKPLQAWAFPAAFGLVVCLIAWPSRSDPDDEEEPAPRPVAVAAAPPPEPAAAPAMARLRGPDDDGDVWGFPELAVPRIGVGPGRLDLFDWSHPPADLESPTGARPR